MRLKRSKRRVSIKVRQEKTMALKKNGCWSMDFVTDELYDACRIKILTIVDNFTRIIFKYKHDGFTPFHAAAYKGQIETLKWLYQKDPQLIFKYKQDGLTSFHAAANEGRIEALE